MTLSEKAHLRRLKALERTSSADLEALLLLDFQSQETGEAELDEVLRAAEILAERQPGPGRNFWKSTALLRTAVLSMRAPRRPAPRPWLYSHGPLPPSAGECGGETAGPATPYGAGLFRLPRVSRCVSSSAAVCCWRSALRPAPSFPDGSGRSAGTTSNTATRLPPPAWRRTSVPYTAPPGCRRAAG